MNREDYVPLQGDIDKWVKWSHRWQMKFNGRKWEMLHIGRETEKRQSKLESTILKNETKHCYLG